jgi:hypothetical protein
VRHFLSSKTDGLPVGTAILSRLSLRALWRTPTGRDALFLSVLTAFNFLLTLRGLRGGHLADNDFVCHYGYSKILADHLVPESGRWFGWRPEHNLGGPFLLFNPPPLLYWAVLVLSWLGLSITGALKLLLCTSFVSVPILSYALARGFATRSRFFPVCAALTASLFSSELAGLDFHFRNGMVNAAVAIPVFLAGLALVRTSLESAEHLSVSWLLAVLSMLVLELLHLQTAYALGLCSAVVALSSRPSHWGRRLLQVGLVCGCATGLAAFWIVPSLLFAGIKPAVVTWIRPTAGLLSNWLSGRIFSSYQAGFSPRYFSESGVGIVLTLLGGGALAHAIWQRNKELLALAFCSLLALWIAAGPRLAFVLSGLPLYDRLLWYRFVSFAIVLWEVLAAWGLAQLVELVAGRRLATWSRIVVIATLVVCGGWSVSVLVERAAMITTEDDFPDVRRDVQTVAAWLSSAPTPRGRIYSEFPKTGVSETISVNYARHMLPVLVDLEDVSGWSYEAGSASQSLVRKGLLHDNPFAILGQSRRLNIQYVTAQSRNFRSALARDARWKRVVTTPSIDLFEAVSFVFAPVEDSGSGLAVPSTLGLADGGAQLKIGPGDFCGPLLIKYDYSPAWRVVSGRATIRPTEDGLFELTLNGAAPSQPILLAWDITRERRRGRWVSLMAALVVIIPVCSRRIRIPSFYREKFLPVLGVTSVALGTLVVAVRSIRSPESTASFGIQGGMTSASAANEIQVGSYDAASNGGGNYLLPTGWQASLAPDRTGSRYCQSCEVMLSLPPGGSAMLVVTGTSIVGSERASAEGSPSRLFVEVQDPGSKAVLCQADGELGTPLMLSTKCSMGTAEGGPGRRVLAKLTIPNGALVERIRLDSDLVYVEGEAFVNRSDDEGDASYYTGLPGCFAHGVWMTFIVREEGLPITVSKNVMLPREGDYELWFRVLAEDSTPAHRATLVALVDNKEVGRVQPVGGAWPREGICPLPVAWMRAGTLHAGRDFVLSLRAERGPLPPSIFDLDLVAFVPLPK